MRVTPNPICTVGVRLGNGVCGNNLCTHYFRTVHCVLLSGFEHDGSVVLDLRQMESLGFSCFVSQLSMGTF